MDFDREKIYAAFVAESGEGLQRMEEALLAAESDPANAGLLDEIFRVVHTLKGNASLLGFPDLAGLAHVVEDLLDALRHRQITLSRDLISLLLSAVDALRDLVPTASKMEGLSPSHEELKRKIVQSVSGARSPEPNPSGEEAVSPAIPSSHLPTESRSRTVRVDTARLDQMLNCAGEIAIAQGRLRRIIEATRSEKRGQILEIQGEIDRLFRSLQEQVMGVRMVPIGPLFQQFLRPVRDLSKSHRKLARLELVGGEVEVDTRVLEHLRDPLLHMLRNAIDHGIERPEDRLAQGKNPCGVLALRAFHSSGNIFIQLSDDGAGFNRAQILAKAKELGLVKEGARPSDQEIFQLVFRPGFSTAEDVSDLSGRGVGMDVVRRNIDAIRGRIDIQSTAGQGSIITVCLPLTLAIIEGFAVSAAGEAYVIPVEMIRECLELPAQQFSTNGGGVVDVRGEALPFLRLRDVFGLHGNAPQRENVVVVQNEDGRAGLAVDELLGETQAIIKPLNRLFRHVPGVCGSTITNDGRVALILDTRTLMQYAVSQHTGAGGQRNISDYAPAANLRN